MVPPQTEINIIMKNKKIIPLIILLTLLVLLIVSYVLLASYNKEKSLDDAAESESEGAAVAVLGIRAEDVTAIRYKTEKAELSLERAAGEWIITGDEKFPVDQAAVAKMLSAVTSLSASRRLEGGNEADFGLDTPSLTVTLISNGEEHIVSLGDVNSYNDKTYCSYSGRVFMISDTISEAFPEDKTDLFGAEDSFPSARTKDSVITVKVKNTKGDEAVISDDKGIEDIIFEVQKSFNFNILKDYWLDSSELADYGITETSASVVIEYEYNSAKATFEVLVGKNAEGNCFYALPGGSTVYGIDITGYETIMSYAYYTSAETAAE